MKPSALLHFCSQDIISLAVLLDKQETVAEYFGTWFLVTSYILCTGSGSYHPLYVIDADAVLCCFGTFCTCAELGRSSSRSFLFVGGYTIDEYIGIACHLIRNVDQSFCRLRKGLCTAASNDPILRYGVDEKNPARRQDFSLAFGAYGSSFHH